MAANTLGRNITFQIYNGDGTPLEGLILHKSVVDSVVMSLGDNITGDVYYKDNTLAVTMQEYIEYKRNPDDENELPVRFVLVNPPTILREGMVKDNGELKGMTKYSFTFYHPMYQLGNMPFCDVAVSSDQQRYLSENKVFSWIGYPDDYIAKLNKNLDGTEWIIEKSNRFPALKNNVLSEVLSFENNTIADALKKFYDTWEVPYVVDVVSSGETSYAQGKRFKVVIGLPSNEIYASESDRQLMQPYVFRMGKGVGLKNNSRTPRNNKIITRISGYGSEDNIPYGYPQIVWDGAEDDPRLEYPLYNGIAGGRYVKLIKHPFTRKCLMPSIYSETVNKKVNPNAVGYDPTIELKDYYDAIRTEEYPYVNEINPLAPSYESHQFDVKPEMDDGQSNVEILNAIPLNADLTPAETWDDTMDGDGNYIQSYFQITLPQLSFDLYACAAITQEMQINMRGGACIGCTFPIQVDWDDYKANFYDQDGNFAPDGEQRNLAKYPKSNLGSISVVVQKEYQTFGTIMPNVFKQPKNGDKFVVLGISLPSEYISNAEKRLDGEMKSYMLENNVHYYDYPLKFDEYFLATHTYILEQLKPNSVVRFDFAGNELQLFVKQLTIKYGQGVLPQYDITLTDNIEVVLNQIGQVADDVERLSSVISMMREGYSRNVWMELANKLSKTSDDTARGKITFQKGLTAWDAVINRVHSDNYTDDTGYELTNNNGAGSSQLTVDYIRARRKLIAESVEVKESHASAGDEIITGATAEISRVDYFDSNGNQLGVSGAMSEEERQLIARVRCYFLASDGERDVENWWAVGDLAYCQTQNLTRTPRDSRIGTAEKAGNVFWWRQVTGIDDDGAVTLDDGKEYHYIDFAVNYAEEQAGTYNNSAYLSDIPASGDKCMQFGNVSNSDRMNAIMVEVNGAGNANAPDIVFYRGIYTYSLERCWWGGESCRKAKLSPSTGWEFTGPDFKFITEYGQTRVPVDRGAWMSIQRERDVREPHDNVRKCYYYDRVTHLGSLWLCIKSDNYIWLKNEGTTENPVWNYWGTTDPRTQPDYSDDLYRRVLDYTTVEPSENAPTVWQKQVAKGEDGTSPWEADLDNEMDSVACYANGHPTSEQTVTTGVSLVYGGERRAATVAVYRDRACEHPYTNDETMENGLAVYWTKGAWSSLTVSVKVGSALTISGSMNFYIKITDGESGVFRLLVFTVNGIRPGDDGKPATIYNLLPSEKQVSVGRNADGTYNPATFSLTCGYVKNVGGVMTTVDNVQAKIDDKYELYYRLRGRESQQMGNYVLYRNTHGGQVPVWSVGDYDEVEFVLSTAASTLTVNDSNIIDRETVPVVADGKQGEQGNDGDDAVTVRFSRNPVVFQGNSLGQSVNTTAIRIYPVVYVGGTPVNATSVTLKSKPSGLNVDIRNVAAEWDGVDTQPVDISPTGIGVAEGALTGIVELTIGYGDNKTITGSVVTTVAHSGTSGNGVKEIFKVSDTKPATPSGTDVLPAGWSEQPPVLTTGLTYSVTGDWTRSGNTLTSPATTADDGVYRSRVRFTTAGKATIAVRLTVSSEETYDIAALSAADNNFLERKTAGDIRDYSGTDLVANLSGDGTTGVFLLTVDAEGEHFFDVVYAKDSSTDDYNDNAVLELNIDTIWVSTSKIVTDASGNETAAGWSEPVRWNGPQGKMGRNFYYDGVYDSSRTYSVTDYEAPFVSYGANYYVRVGEGSCQGVTPSASSPYWELMTSTFKYLITEAIFSEYAKLGSWVFNSDYMFSANDASGQPRGSQDYTGMTDAKKTSGFIPTVAMDAANGRSSFSGDKVRFNPDGSGWLANQNIKWYANGSAEFNGKVTATSGSIAGFEINTDYLGTHNDYRTQGFVMNKQSLAYYYGGKYVSIGTNDNAISVTGFSGATALYTNGGSVLHKLGANDSFIVGDASAVNTGETVILSKFEARGDVAIGGSVITDSSMQDYLPLAENTRKGQLLLFSSGDWEIKTSYSVWIYNEDGVVTNNGSTFERTGPFILVCVGKNKDNVALWQYFNGR